MSASEPVQAMKAGPGGWWPGLIAIAVTTGTEGLPVLATDGAGGAIIAWQTLALIGIAFFGSSARKISCRRMLLPFKPSPIRPPAPA